MNISFHKRLSIIGIIIYSLFPWHSASGATQLDDVKAFYRNSQLALRSSTGRFRLFAAGGSQVDYGKIRDHLNILNSYIDFDIAQFTEAKRKLDGEHDKAVKSNSLALFAFSATNGIFSPALHYPQSKVSPRDTNDVSIAGAGSSAILNLSNLYFFNYKYHVTESVVLRDFINKTASEELFSADDFALVDECLKLNVGYIGVRIAALKQAHHSHHLPTKPLAWNYWLCDYWSRQFTDSFKSVSSCSDTILGPKPIKLSSKQLAERIAMLGQLSALTHLMSSWASMLASMTDMEFNAL